MNVNILEFADNVGKGVEAVAKYSWGIALLSEFGGS